MLDFNSLIKYQIGVPKLEELEKNKPINVLMGDGVYRHTTTGVIHHVEKVRGLDGGNLIGLPKGEEIVEYALENKVPFDYLQRIMDFFKFVHAKNRTEACAVIYLIKEDDEILERMPKEIREDMEKWSYRQEGSEFLLYCPTQRNSSTITVFREDKVYAWLRLNGGVVVSEWHSHHTMDAFWSGEDINNQQDFIYYGVLGKINTEDKILFKYVLNGELTNIPVSEVFEFPKVKTVEVKRQRYTITEGFEHLIDEAEVEFEENLLGEEDYEGVIKPKNEFDENWLSRCNARHNMTESNYKNMGVGVGFSQKSPNIYGKDLHLPKSRIENIADEDIDTEDVETVAQSRIDMSIDQYLAESDGEGEDVGKTLVVETENSTVVATTETETTTETTENVETKNVENNITETPTITPTSTPTATKPKGGMFNWFNGSK